MKEFSYRCQKFSYSHIIKYLLNNHFLVYILSGVTEFYFTLQNKTRKYLNSCLFYIKNYLNVQSLISHFTVSFFFFVDVLEKMLSCSFLSLKSFLLFVLSCLKNSVEKPNRNFAHFQELPRN